MTSKSVFVKTDLGYREFGIEEMNLHKNEAIKNKAKKNIELEDAARIMFSIAMLNEGENKGVIIENFQFSSDEWEPYEVSVKDVRNDRRIFRFNPYASIHPYWIGDVSQENKETIFEILTKYQQGYYENKFVSNGDQLIVEKEKSKLEKRTYPKKMFDKIKSLFNI